VSSASKPGEAISQAEAFARIRLLRSPNVGPVSYAQLLRRFGGGIAALAALPDLASRGGGRYSVTPVARIEAEVLAVRRAGARYLFHDSPEYPPLLRQADGAPPILIARGDAALASRPTVALVGARNASAAAMKLARIYATELAAKGFVVVSGLARGIDGAAHMGALAGAAEGGGTIGVIAGGIDVTYPPEHADLQQQIAIEGLLLTEQLPGTEPLARHFPARNRIIAGLAIGTVVVEAAPRSGSLITARLAGEIGREVMAVPGSPLDARSQGCNQLIRDGATLVQSADDVIEVLSDFHGAPHLRLRETFVAALEMEGATDEAANDAGSVDIAGLLTTAPVGVDDLIRLSGGSPGAVQMALLELELAGRLARHAGGRVSLESS
jgi:DNA processing protein